MKKILLFVIDIINKLRNLGILTRKKVSYGKNLRITGKIRIHGSGSFSIGNDVTINSTPNVNASAGGYISQFTIAQNARLTIGNHVGISHCAITAYNCVEIEDDVLIGSNCMIADTDFHSLDPALRKIDDGTGVASAPIRICKGAFVGARSIILKGVTIGENSIVGAGSVVTKSIPANEIWGGNPAKLIRKIDLQ